MQDSIRDLKVLRNPPLLHHLLLYSGRLKTKTKYTTAWSDWEESGVAWCFNWLQATERSVSISNYSAMFLHKKCPPERAIFILRRIIPQR